MIDQVPGEAGDQMQMIDGGVASIDFIGGRKYAVSNAVEAFKGAISSLLHELSERESGCRSKPRSMVSAPNCRYLRCERRGCQ